MNWACTSGTKEEKAQQTRLRGRRRCVWDAVDAASKALTTGDKVTTEDEVVAALQSIQTLCQAGITRVEGWAQTALKALKQQDVISDKRDVVSIAEAYKEERIQHLNRAAERL